MQKIDNLKKQSINAGSISFGLVMAISGAIFSIINLIGSSIAAAKQIEQANKIHPPAPETYINSNFMQSNNLKMY